MKPERYVASILAVAAPDPRPANASMVAKRCTQIADAVVPEYRGTRKHSCTAPTARRWQAAWDGACVALGHDPARYRGGVTP